MGGRPRHRLPELNPTPPQPRERQMKLTIFAATGGIGRQILEQAIAAGHDVTAVARNPQKLPGELSRQVRVVSAAPIGTVPSPARPNPPKHDPGDGFIMAHLLNPLTKAALRKHYADLAQMEDILRDSDLDWTAIRPPRLTDKPLTGTYRTARGQNLRRGLFIPRANVAHHMLRALDQPETIRQTIGVGS